MKLTPRRKRSNKTAAIAFVLIVLVFTVPALVASCMPRPAGAISPLQSWLACPPQAELPPGAVCIEPAPSAPISAPAGNIVDPIQECAPGASCYYAFAPWVTRQ